MRNRYQEQLDQLHVDLIQMGAQCERAIAAAEKTLKLPSDALVADVHKAEVEIDQKEKDIENLCMKMLLRQQPVAGDLRLISAALKMISDMERIGDQACDIADIARMIQDRGLLEELPIRKMAQAAIHMLTDAVDAFVRHDVELARKVMVADDIVDEAFVQIKEKLIETISQDASKGEVCLDYLMIAKYYERIGDHAVNIAEWVEYSITGQHKPGQDTPASCECNCQ